MKKLIKLVMVGTTVLALTGCGYTQDDLAEVENIIMSGDGSHVQTDESNARLDANLDGFITPADYVEIDTWLKEHAEKVNE